MILYPDLYVENILKIDKDIIKKYNLKALLLDIDNTILYYDRSIIDGLQDWVNQMKSFGVKLCILSNTNHIEKAQKIANIIDIPYIYFAKKPLKSGFKRALDVVNVQNKYVAMIGDQIFTDVLGANRMKMFSILTKPLEEKDIFVTKFKRPIEELIIKNYLKKKEKSTNVSK